MKRFFAMFLSLVMIVGITGCTEKPLEKLESSSSVQVTENKLIVGLGSDLTGDFMYGWGYNSSDLDVINLLHSNYLTIYSKDTQLYEMNKMVVKTMETFPMEDGSKEFVFTLNPNLKFSDGSKITAKDYAFTVLLCSSPQYGQLLADNFFGSYFTGFNEFSSGESSEFSGVKVMAEDKISLTVARENLPYFFENYLVQVYPLPMNVIAPKCDINIDGNAAQISGDFSVEMLEKTLLDINTGYRYNPKITSGAYMLESYNTSSKQAVLKINPYFLGNYEGQKPSIETLIVKGVNNATQLDELKVGAVDLVVMTSGTDTINAGLDLVESGKEFSYNSYLRNGYGQITFTCDIGPTQFTPVRQAIAHIIDIPQFAKNYSGGYAQAVYGYYGASTWMAQENKERINKEFNKYAYDLEKAELLLISDGWTLNKDGKDFVKSTDTLRYKKVNGQLMPLVIKWANTADNDVTDMLLQILPQNMEAVGMKLEPTTMDYAAMMDNIYGNTEEHIYNMYNFGTGFYPVYDPMYTYIPDDEYMGIYNYNYIKDEELFNLAQILVTTHSDDKELFSERWMDFNKYWNELMPDIPLYSDEYHDFYNYKLNGYSAESFWGWTEAILYSTII